MTKKVEQPQNEKDQVDRLSTKDFLRIYIDHLKKDKSREDLLLYLNQNYKKKKPFDNQTLDLFIDRAFLFVAKQKYPNLLPPLKKVILASEDDKTSLDGLDL